MPTIEDDLAESMRRNEVLTRRVAELEGIVTRLLNAEPDRHKEALGYEGPHDDCCVWCSARRILNP